VYFNYNVVTIIYEDDAMTEKEHVINSIFSFKTTYVFIIFYLFYVYESFSNRSFIELCNLFILKIIYTAKKKQ